MASLLADTPTSAACSELPPTNVRFSCASTAKPKIYGHPSTLALCSCSPEPFHPARCQPPPSARLSWGILPVLAPWSSCQCIICTPPALPTVAQQATPAPLWVSYFTWCTPVTFPSILSHLFPITALLKGWHAPSPSTAYRIFGKTYSLLAMLRCESHLDTMALGVAQMRLALPAMGIVP